MVNADATKNTRPDFDRYFMGIALAVRERADCLGTKVGAVIVVDRRVVSTGYNGTPSGMKNCTEGGCYRCRERDKYGPGEAYDRCICVHGEQNAVVTAARLGIPVGGGTVYTTLKPCFTCLKEILQSGMVRVIYLNEWQHPDPDLELQYSILEASVPEGVTRLEMDDPRAE
jgi:dCMP deaminase